MLYELARGPLMWASLVISLGGIVYRAVQLFGLTRARQQSFFMATAGTEPTRKLSPEELKLERIARFQNSIMGKHPVMTIVSVLFHGCLFAAPLFLLAHNLRIYETLRVCLFSIPDGLADAMTVIFLACCVLFLFRRIAVPKVAAISSGADYLLLFMTALPFLTGFLAYHQLFDYKTVIIIHMLAGEAMLVFIPFSKLGHMVFFFFARLFLSSEYALGRGSRTWSA